MPRAALDDLMSLTCSFSAFNPSIKYAWYALFLFVAFFSLTTAPVGLDGGIRWLPGYVHRHSQFLCHRTEPGDLPECYIVKHSIGG